MHISNSFCDCCVIVCPPFSMFWVLVKNGIVVLIEIDSIWNKKSVSSRELASPATLDCLAGLVVKASASGVEDLGFKPRLRRDFSWSSHTSDLKIGAPVATLPGAWGYRVRAGTGRPVVSIVWQGEVESWICNFYLSVAVRKLVWADPCLRYASMLLGC